MAIDASIPLQVRQFQAPDRMNMMAKVLGIQAAQQQSEVQRMQMEEARRKIAEEASLNEAYAGSLGADGAVDRNRLFSTLAGKNLGSRIPALQKTFLETDAKAAELEKVKREQAKIDLEMGIKKAERVGSILSQANPQNWGQVRQVVKTEFGKDLPEQFDPMFVQTSVAQGQTLTEKLKAEHDRITREETGRHNRTTEGLTVRGQDISVENNRRSVNAQYANANATREVAKATRDAATIQRGYENEQGLRKEFEALPEVKKYKQALPSYKGIEDAVKRNTTQSDINIVYGIAKLYDPDSVVREGEYATVANSPNIPERIKGYAQYLAGGGRLTAEVKTQILAEAKSRMASYENEFVNARKGYENIATRTGVDPTRVFPTPHSPAVMENTGSGNGGRSASGRVQNGPSVFDQADAILRGGK